MWATPETRPTETTRVVIRTTDRASPWKTGLTLQTLDVLRSALRSESGILVLLFVWLHHTLGEMKVFFFLRYPFPSWLIILIWSTVGCYWILQSGKSQGNIHDWHSDLIAGRHHSNNKEHNTTTLTSPGMRVSTGYVNSSKGTSSKKDVPTPQPSEYPLF